MEMKSVTDALKRILRQQEPFPAMVMDRYWKVLMMNECAPRFFNCFIDMTARAGPQNMFIGNPSGAWKNQGTRSGVARLSRR
jgi:hypothetical protein